MSAPLPRICSLFPHRVRRAVRVFAMVISDVCIVDKFCIEYPASALAAGFVYCARELFFKNFSRPLWADDDVACTGYAVDSLMPIVAKIKT